jgi:hypothetical protein
MTSSYASTPQQHHQHASSDREISPISTSRMTCAAMIGFVLLAIPKLAIDRDVMNAVRLAEGAAPRSLGRHDGGSDPASVGRLGPSHLDFAATSSGTGSSLRAAKAPVGNAVGVTDGSTEAAELVAPGVVAGLGDGTDPELPHPAAIPITSKATSKRVIVALPARVAGFTGRLAATPVCRRRPNPARSPGRCRGPPADRCSMSREGRSR